MSSMNNHNNNNNTNFHRAMSALVLSKGVSLLGSWHEDVFTEDLLQKIAAYAAAEKGKKAKVKLSGAGLRISRPRFLQADSSQFFAFDAIKTVTRNPHAPRCVMFILADQRCRYQIIAVRCQSDVDASDLINFSAQMKKEQKVSNVEFKKRDNGNWTLRERSAHNANRHMAELFNEQTNGGGGDGVIAISPASPAVITTQRSRDGSVSNHVPVLDASRPSVRGSYVKRQHSSSTKRASRSSADIDGEYIVETVVDTGDRTDGVDEMRALVEQQQNISAGTSNGKPVMAQPGVVSVYSHGVNTHTTHEALPSRPQVLTAVPAAQQQKPQPAVVHRAAPVAYEARIIGGTTTGYFPGPNPWGSHRRVSGVPGSSTLPHQNRSRTDSLQGNFDRVSMLSVSKGSSRSRSMRSIPTTIERSIEDTYARPVILRRYGSAQLVAGRPRPASYHVVGTGTNELQIYNGRGLGQGDVLL
ncbi:hypothetical protein EGW08_020048 [Elysia chlorotica]|uniref:Uncharacterized protein n=1 Tax=Elysia chlorotica TaxID=188477 RepID=A0A3S0ZPH6_ELYCH|nr:hypothetical protein EGW08_020048 [Elysia chlorotica]